MRSKPRALASAALALAGVAVAYALHAGGLLDRLEGFTWDARARLLAAPAPPDLPIRLILVDEESLARVSREQEDVAWPWPREYFAAILRYLVEDGARVVAFDLDFTEASRYGVDDDHLLREALAAAPGTVLPLRLRGETRDWPCPPAPLDVEGLGLAPEMQGATFSHRDVTGKLALAYGHVIADTDGDGVVRRVRPAYRFGGRAVPLLAAAASLRGEGQPRLALHEDRVGILGKELPLDDSGRLVLRYRRPGPFGHLYPAHSAAGVLADVASGTGPRGLFRGCYVLIGVSAENLFDNWATPVKTITPGVEVHATALDNLLQGGFFRPAPAVAPLLLSFLAAAAGAWLMLRGRSAAASLGSGAAALALPAAAAVAAHASGIAWPAVWPVAATALSLAGAGAVGYATEGRRRRYLRRAFEHYVSPEVIARLVEDPSRLRLGGERREVSVLVSDLEGFSSFSEAMDAQELARFLNDFLGAMTAVLLEEGCTLDKYLGDGIVAFWNAPVDEPDHALRALRAAVLCQRALAARAEEFAAQVGRPLKMRVGVHTGDVSVGNFGSPQRFDYTALGDTVNLASRLEGANKRFGTGTLVSEETWRRAGPVLPGRQIGRVLVVGRTAPVGIYEPWGLPGEPPPPGFRAFDDARAFCVAGDWDAADRALAACPGDPVAALWRERVRALHACGATAWDDLFELKEK